MALFRYPGAKTKASVCAAILEALPQKIEHFSEPFVGTGAVVLALAGASRLVKNAIIRLNDLDIGVAAIWQCVTTDLEPLLARIECFKPSVEDFDRFKA